MCRIIECQHGFSCNKMQFWMAQLHVQGLVLASTFTPEVSISTTPNPCWQHGWMGTKERWIMEYVLCMCVYVSFEKEHWCFAGEQWTTLFEWQRAHLSASTRCFSYQAEPSQTPQTLTNTQRVHPEHQINGKRVFRIGSDGPQGRKECHKLNWTCPRKSITVWLTADL